VADDPSAVLWALPAFAPRDLRAVGGGVAHAGDPVAWLAPSACLAVSGFMPLPGGARHLLIDSAAHALPLHATEPDELALLDLLARRRGRLAAGELLSGPGLVLLQRAVCRLRGVPAQRLGAAQILAKALAARCPECSRAVAIFCALLGDVAAQAALALGARGGVYLGGDIVPWLGDWFLRSPFRRRFEAAGQDRELLRAIPTVVVRPGLAPLPVGTGDELAAIRSPG